MPKVKYIHGHNLLLPLFKYSRFQCVTRFKQSKKIREDKVLLVSFLSTLVEHSSNLFDI